MYIDGRHNNDSPGNKKENGQFHVREITSSQKTYNTNLSRHPNLNRLPLKLQYIPQTASDSRQSRKRATF